MAPEQVTGPPFELRITRSDWAVLHRHLFPGDHDEHAAVLLCGMANSARSRRLLVREVVCAEDGATYLPGKRGYRQLTGEFVTHLIRRAKDEKLVYLAVHNHGGSDSVSFSATDLGSHERGYPTLLDLTGLPVGAVVLAERALAGDIWLPDGSRCPVVRTVIVGGSPTVLTPRPEKASSAMHSRYNRQSLLYGETGQHILGQSKVAIVGAGGVGMLLVQALSRLGVGTLVIIDPDRVDPTNLPRLPEATRVDAMEWLDRDGRRPGVRTLARRLARHKVQVARRIARRANDAVSVHAIVGDVADDHTARLITDCDFVFLAADTMLARDVVNQIAYQFLIPTVQVGSKVVADAKTGQIHDIFSAVRVLGNQSGCLRCNGLVDLRRLGEESVGNPEQVRNQRYVNEPEVHAPSVITLNAVGAGWAADQFMQYMVGLHALPTDFQILRTGFEGRAPTPVALQERNVDPDCHVCGPGSWSAFARGDQHELPTRVAVRSPMHMPYLTLPSFAGHELFGQSWGTVTALWEEGHLIQLFTLQGTRLHAILTPGLRGSIQIGLPRGNPSLGGGRIRRLQLLITGMLDNKVTRFIAHQLRGIWASRPVLWLRHKLVCLLSKMAWWRT